MTDPIREAVERLEKALPFLPNTYGEMYRVVNTDDLSAILSLVRGVMPRPIGEAPRDGKPILTNASRGEWPFVLHYGHVGRFTNTPNMWIGHESGALQDSDLCTYIDLKPLAELLDLPLPQEEPHG